MVIYKAMRNQPKVKTRMTLEPEILFPKTENRRLQKDWS